MYEPHPNLTPTGYARLYNHCIDAGWTAEQLTDALTRAERQAATPAYIAATLRAMGTEGPPVVVDESSTTTTQPQAIRTARIDGHPTAGRTIQPHRYESADAYCQHCQLPAPNRIHLR